jgi:hypothetical protein
MSAAALGMMLVSLAGCGSEEPKDANQPGSTSGSYLPLATGNSWTFNVINHDTDETSLKTQSVEELEPVPGNEAILAYRLRTGRGALATVSWQEDRGGEIVRYMEQNFDFSGSIAVTESYDPYKLRVDQRAEHTAAGASFMQAYNETHTDVVLATTTVRLKEEQWTVEAVDEAVTVPAGTFACLRLRRSGDPTQPIKTYFFARGVGKVKEMGGQTEELVSYDTAR